MVPAIPPRIEAHGLVHDHRGAVMVMAVPMIFLMIGMLYYLIGVAEQTVMRQQLQDAADSGALASAVMHARGMNMIALTNLVMASIIALLLVTQLLQMLMSATVLIGGAMLWSTAGATGGAIAPATNAGVQAGAAFEALAPGAQAMLAALHGFEVSVKYGMPVAADARVSDAVALHAAPPARLGFAVPGQYPMPVEDGSWQELCDKAAELAEELVLAPSGSLIAVPELRAVLGSAFGEVASNLSELFCGTDGVNIPGGLPNAPLGRSISTVLPPGEAELACTDGLVTDAEQPPASSVGRRQDYEGGTGQRLDVMREQDAACRDAAFEVARATPGEDGGPSTRCEVRLPGTGSSSSPETCAPCASARNGVACPEYQNKVTEAASACRSGAGPRKDYWNYQQRVLTVQVTLSPVGPSSSGELDYELVQGAPSFVDTPILDSAAPPCGEGGTISSDHREQATYQPNAEYETAAMLCTVENYPEDPRAIARGGGQRTLREWQQQLGGDWAAEPTSGGGLRYQVQWTAALFVQSCGEHIDNLDQVRLGGSASSITLASGIGGGDCGLGQTTHMRMPRDPAPVLGEERFQVRAVVVGEARSKEGHRVARGVPFRLRDQQDDGGGLGGDRPWLRSLFVAQAEYYFDTQYDPAQAEQVAHPSEEWLWDMRWRARMRRVRLPEGFGALSRSAPAALDIGSCSFDAPSADMDDACRAASARHGGGSDNCPGPESDASLAGTLLSVPGDLYLH